MTVLAERLKRAVSGIVVVDKPQGITSNACLQKVKYLYKAAKAGHTGSLDPLATGVLPVCLGEATKVSQFLLNAEKEYATVVMLGGKTTTADREGEVVEVAEVPALEEAAILRILRYFVGESLQIPPAYSALKQNGVPFYKLAREGREIETRVRTIFIHELELMGFSDKSLSLRVRCSKGTYIRSLAEDIAVALGTLGHVGELRRLQSGPFRLQDSVTIEKLKAVADLATLDAMLLPMDRAVDHLPMVSLQANDCLRLRQGQKVNCSACMVRGQVRVYESDTFIGIGSLDDAGVLSAVRLLSY